MYRKKLTLLLWLILVFIFGLTTNGVVLKAQDPGALETELASSIDMIVAADGSGDFATVQSAINAAPNNPASPTVIFIRKGSYREKVYVPSSKSRLTLIGEDADSTIIVWDDYAGRIVDGIELNTFTSQTIQIDANDFKAMNLTFENDARPDGTGNGQNVAVSCYGDRSIFLHCRLVSWQDTYYSGSDDRQYFKDCFIEGAVDYIFGHTTVIFDSCQIHTVRSSGYITAASTLENYLFGYVFLNCLITAPPGITNVYLGRPWKTHAQTVFFECLEYENVSATGWHVWGGRENTCYYAEYNCTGPGSDTSKRVEWSHQLTPEQAASYTQENIFSAGSSTAFSQDWDPAVEEDSLWSILKKHSTMYMDPVNLDANIASLQVNGEALENWDPAVYKYSIEVDSDTAQMPVLTAEAENPMATVSISYPESLPAWASITVLSKNGANHSTYQIYFSVEESYTNSSLDSIRIGSILLEDFDPGVLEYNVVLPAGTSKYFGLTGYPHVKAARVRTAKPPVLPGEATIEVTAVDGETISTYVLNLTLATSLSVHKAGDPVFTFSNPTDGKVRVWLKNETPGISITIYDISGKLVYQEKIHDSSPSEREITLDTGLENGLYFMRAESSQWITSGKLLIQH